MKGSLGVPKWNFQKYDAFNREVFRGETVNSNSQSVLQTAFNSHTAPDEVWSSSGGYNGGSFPNIANPSGNDVQHYTFYDQYDFVAALNTNFNFDAGNSYHTKHSSAKGLQTGSVSYNQADHNQYFMSTSYFDTKNRPIQTFETHILSPTLPNRSDVEYNFSGEVLKNRTLHKQVGKPDITELYENEYDHVGRPMKIFHTLNGLKTEILRFSYDPIGRQILKKIKPGFTYKSGLSDIIIRSSEPPLNTQDYVRRNIQLLPGFVYCPDSLAPSLYLGQVDTLGLGGTTDALQTIDYSYNIRNGLRCINCTNELMNNLNQTQNDLFGMKLDFHESGILFDGNIQKQSWIKANDNFLRNYTYTYDASSRLKSAIYQSPNNENFSLPKMTYDKNGNILNLNRKANISGGFGMVDSLSYFYAGNKLLKIDDAVIMNTNIGDFRDSSMAIDYTYWPNGGLKSDGNKKISSIEYNTYLNKIKQITLENGEWLKFNFDGFGNQISRTSSENKSWKYAGSALYLNETLYQLPQPEGRISLDTNQNSVFEFEYRDHLGNLRLSYKDPTTGTPPERMAPEIVQANETDPWGWEIKALGYSNAPSQNYVFQKQERISDFGLNLNWFKYRPFYGDIGRGLQVDRLAEKYSYMTPFQFASNSPIVNVEIDGLEGLYYTETQNDGSEKQVIEKNVVVLTQKPKEIPANATEKQIAKIERQNARIASNNEARVNAVRQELSDFYSNATDESGNSVDFRFNVTSLSVNDTDAGTPNNPKETTNIALANSLQSSEINPITGRNEIVPAAIVTTGGTNGNLGLSNKVYANTQSGAPYGTTAHEILHTFKLDDDNYQSGGLRNSPPQNINSKEVSLIKSLSKPK